MDFFGYQEKAQRNTRRLVFLFAVAVLIIAVGLYFVVTLVVQLTDAPRSEPGAWQPETLLLSVGGTLLIVTFGALYKISQLRSGGSTVARLLGGRPVLTNTQDPLEKRLVNVVEEMAIASGVAVPAIFVLQQEPGINAFAAGFTPDDAAVAVSRGCLEQLDRDELQGVIAHEFSHVFNGDMRLNIRLMGILHGILCIAMGGFILLRTSAYSRRKESAGLMGLGLAMLVLGFVGVFFARLIKAGVSRQREFLADAAAVQFTRYPQGLAGALKKIGGYSQGSQIRNGHAEEASHMFFARGLRASWLSMLATHPPLEDRIRRLDKSFTAVPDPRPTAVGQDSPAAAGLAGVAPVRVDPGQLIARIGAPGPEEVEWARELLAAIPINLVSAAREPFSAQALVFALLLDSSGDLRRDQLRRIEQTQGTRTAMEAQLLADSCRDLPVRARLPLIELCLPALRDQSEEQYGSFRSTLSKLVMADEQVSVFELALTKIIEKNLGAVFEPRRSRHGKLKSADQARPWCEHLLSVLTHLGHDDPEEARRAFAEGEALWEAPLELLEKDRCALEGTHEALERMGSAVPALKRRFLLAAARTAAADGLIRLEEFELLRAFAEVLDCPMPPLPAPTPALS